MHEDEIVYIISGNGRQFRGDTTILGLLGAVYLDCNIIARTTGEHKTLQRLRQGLVRSSLAHEGALPVAAHASSPVSSAAGSRR